MARYAGDPNLGGLLSPRGHNRPEWYARHRFPYAADNDAYSGFDEGRYIAMLDRLAEAEHRPMWVTCPDVVGDAHATDRLFDRWAPFVRDTMGLPVAYVAQNGIEPDHVPWDDVACVFLGGDDDFKLGAAGARIAARARTLGVPLHIGRVNSLRRIAYARWLGAASVDGSSASRFSAIKLPFYLGELRQARLPIHEEDSC